MNQSLNNFNYHEKSIDSSYKDNFYYVKEQTEGICLTAVQQNGLALKDVKKQTEEICLTAVQQNRLALKDVKRC